MEEKPDIQRLTEKITQLENRIKELEESNFLYKNIIEKSPFGIHIFDEQGYLYKCNNALKEILGVPSKEYGIGTFNLFTDPFIEAAGMKEKFSRVYKGETIKHEFKLDLGNKKNRWETRKESRIIKESIYPIKNEKGDVIYAAAFLQDITAQKNTINILEKNEAYLQSVLSSMSDLMFIIDKEGVFTGYHQPPGTDLYLPPEEFIGKKYKDVMPPHIIREIDKAFKHIKDGKGVYDFDYSLTINKRIKWSNARISAFRNAQGKFEGIIILSRNISDRIAAEQAVKEHEIKLKEAQHIAGMGNWELDIVNNKLYWSDEIYTLFGVEPQSFKATYEAFLEYVHPDDRQMVNDAYTNSLKTKNPYVIIHRLKLKSGEIRYVREQCRTTYDEQGNPLWSIGVVLDVTAQQLAELHTQEHKEKFQFLSQTATELMTLNSEEEIFDYIGSRLQKLIPDAYIAVLPIIDKNKTFVFGLYGFENSIIKKLMNIIGFDIRGKVYDIKYDINDLFVNGILKIFEPGIMDLLKRRFPAPLAQIILPIVKIKNVYCIGLYSNGSIVAGIQILTRNETNYADLNKRFIETFIQQAASALEIRRKERELREIGIALKHNLEEKDVLLKEVHHRVKNNLQTVRSLLFKQQRISNDEGIKKVLQESMNRISSMALIHEQIYRSEDIKNIDFTSYIKRFSKQLLETYNHPGTRIELDVKVEGVHLPLDKAIPVALMLNELISNALKYAFQDKKEGRISIWMDKILDNDEKNIQLIVSDNGKGLPDDFNIDKNDSLGMFIVKNIATRQLHGKLSISNKNGTEFVIKFKG